MVTSISLQPVVSDNEDDGGEEEEFGEQEGFRDDEAGPGQRGRRRRGGAAPAAVRSRTSEGRAPGAGARAIAAGYSLFTSRGGRKHGPKAKEKSAGDDDGADEAGTGRDGAREEEGLVPATATTPVEVAEEADECAAGERRGVSSSWAGESNGDGGGLTRLSGKPGEGGEGGGRGNGSGSGSGEVGPREGGEEHSRQRPARVASTNSDTAVALRRERRGLGEEAFLSGKGTGVGAEAGGPPGGGQPFARSRWIYRDRRAPALEPDELKVEVRKGDVAQGPIRLGSIEMARRKQRCLPRCLSVGGARQPKCMSPTR